MLVFVVCLGRMEAAHRGMEAVHVAGACAPVWKKSHSRLTGFFSMMSYIRLFSLALTLVLSK